jgi:hypothetical protein
MMAECVAHVNDPGKSGRGSERGSCIKVRVIPGMDFTTGEASVVNRVVLPAVSARRLWWLPGLLLFVFAFPLAALHADSSGYPITYTLGRDAHDAFVTRGSLRPGFRNDMDRGTELNLTLQSRQMTSWVDGTLDSRLVETRGVFQQRFAESGFGYGFNLGLGVVYPAQESGTSEIYRGDRQTYLIGDISAGPTYQSGSLRSGLRLGVRQSTFSDVSEEGFSSRSAIRDYSRSAGYLSLDGRLQMGRGAELSLSVFVDDPEFFGARDWRSEGFSFGGLGTSTLGLEMGLNF